MRTPLRRSQWLSAASGADVSIKLEGIQTTFSYKLRGALNAVLRLQERQQHPPALVTASAGNHGRGLAVAAALARLPLIVYVPEDAPRIKLDAIRAAGADVIPCRDYDEAEARAREHGARGPAVYISPYAHPDVIAGAGTVGARDPRTGSAVETIVCPVGGGGLISGTAIARGARRRDLGRRNRVVFALHSGPRGRPHRRHRRSPDAWRTGSPATSIPTRSPSTWCAAHVAGIATVSEPAIADAIRALVAEERVIAEGAAATAVAAVLGGKVPLRGRRVAIILSGANIDPHKLRELIWQRETATLPPVRGRSEARYG